MHALQGKTNSALEHQLNSIYISLTPFLAQTLMPNSQKCQQIYLGTNNSIERSKKK